VSVVTVRVHCTNRHTRTRTTFKRYLTSVTSYRTPSTYVDDTSRTLRPMSSAVTTSTTWPAPTSQSPNKSHSNATSNSPTEYSCISVIRDHVTGVMTSAYEYLSYGCTPSIHAVRRVTGQAAVT